MLSYVSSLGCWPSSSSWADQQSLKQMLGSWLGRIPWCAYTIPTSSIPVPGVFAHWKCTWRFQLQAQSSMLPEAKKTNVRQNRSRASLTPLPESIRLIASDGSKVETRPHLVPERRGYSFNICVAPRCETHMRFKRYTFSIFFIRFHNYGMRE